ncbi:speckle targeted PIP5K1A-regulated poly(A) polymerase-like [Thrips palmi]|uniref:Speckle targeted PIP5K1A-regulated poly(A) polymerase-like n=1 Tax=Thrips palmi TaxID=161013 RepID=A0A6P8YPU8_THRPL|nr:speckle targeted PIP5K1A-regulated poly(A) polymerase-like [Thrips palmi]
MSTSDQRPPFTFCEVCKIDMLPENYGAHVNGKKHKLQEERLGTKKHIEETGLYIRGVPPNVDAAEMSKAFGKYGYIAKIEIYGRTAFVHYVDKSSCDEALKHQHVVCNTTLYVDRRKLIDRPNPVRVQNKRGFDNTPKTSKTPINDKSKGQKKPALITKEILDKLARPAPISEQMTKLKELILAGPELCNDICNKICSDVMLIMNTATFSTCELLAFGSMTTGLAFKDSDLDVYAHLELNPQTHLLKGPGGKQDQKKIFNIAKGSFYRRPQVFKDIVPIQGAKIPLIKFVHINTNVACDVNFRDAIGYYNSNLLRHYLDMNERFFNLMVFLKFWARVHDFISSSKLSSFALCMLGLNFILSLKNEVGDRIIPTVDDLLNQSQSSDSDIYVNEWKCSFDNTPIKVTLPDSPNYSLVGLLKGFFEHIATLPFQTDVLSVSTGGLIPRELFNSPDELPNAYICYKNFILKHPGEVLVKPEHYAVIHDPFRLNHNLLGRVNLQTMQSFVNACKKAAEDCAVAMNNKEMESTLLHHLLDARKRPPQVEVQGTSQIKDHNIGPTSLILDNPFIGNENPLLDLADIICMIFEKILLLNVTKLEEDKTETSCKVSRADDMKDVHENSQPRILVTCEGKIDVWNGRKKAKNLLKLINPLTFEDEVKVSEYLKQHAGKDTNVPLSFQCELLCKVKQYNLLFDNFPSKRNFKVFWMIIQQQLPKWVTGLKDALKKSSEI